MDIYSLINSKAISEHCRKINYQFTPLEMAYIIWDNETLTIAERHKAFRRVINEYPDMQISKTVYAPFVASLHTFLEAYMNVQNKYIDMFYKDEPNCVYSYCVLYKDDKEYCEDSRIYKTFKMCCKAISVELDDMVGYLDREEAELSIVDISVKKQWINETDDDGIKEISVSFNCDYQPIKFWCSSELMSEYDLDVFLGFDFVGIKIPTPFKKGDVLRNCKKVCFRRSPFVLEGISCWVNDEEQPEKVSYLRGCKCCFDMSTDVYEIDEEGKLYRDHGPDYLWLDYYQGELEYTEKYLEVLSNYIKGKIDYEELIQAYDHVKDMVDTEMSIEEKLIKWGIRK